MFWVKKVLAKTLATKKRMNVFNSLFLSLSLTVYILTFLFEGQFERKDFLAILFDNLLLQAIEILYIYKF